MKQKSLSVKNKTNKSIFSHLKDKKISKIYNSFYNSLKIKEKFAVAVSGGPDSLSLAFLAKCYAIKYSLDLYCFIVDHRLREESSSEAKVVVNILKKININCKILIWHGKKPLKNIQSIARDKRYSLLIKECKKNKIRNLLLGHHLGDVYENFLIRLLRGSGLKGLVSFTDKVQNQNTDIKILRPLLDLEKKNLSYLSKKVFGFFINDPSNENVNFKRIRVRNLLDKLKKEGLDEKKFLLTINNLKDSDESIKFYVKKNINENSKFLKDRDIFILDSNFFNQSHEVIFRSLTHLIQLMGKKYYPARGKSIVELIKKIQLTSFTKITLGGCFVEKVNQTILISKENKH